MTAPQGSAAQPAAQPPPLPWLAYLATATGVLHRDAATPNQDAVASQVTGTANGSRVLVTAVADGHGDSRHFRSDRGSRLAVTAAIAAAAQWVAGQPPRVATATAAAVRTLVPDIVARWEAAVAADIAADPLSEAGAGAGAAPAGSGPVLSPIAYGATLLVSIISADCVVLAQIGDGDIIAVRPDGAFISPVPDDSRLDGRRTTSLCQVDAAAAFRVGVVELATCPVFAVFAATDGFGNAQAAERWQPGVAADLVRFAIERGPDWLGAALPDWAEQCASSEGSGDDCTAALAVNSAARLTSPAPRPAHGRSMTVTARTLTLPRWPGSVPAAGSGKDQATWRPARSGPDRAAEDTWPPGPGDPYLPAADARLPRLGDPDLPGGAGPGRPRPSWLPVVAVVVAVLLLLLALVFLLHRPGPALQHGKSPGPSTSTRPPGPTAPAAGPTAPAARQVRPVCCAAGGRR